MAERTQVLFYTHHPHLVEIAQKTLGTDINVISLAELGVAVIGEKVVIQYYAQYTRVCQP